MSAREAGEPGTVVTPYEDGPLLIRGDFVLQAPDGAIIEPGRRTVALCRCGKSALKPFCDGTHKAINFKAGTHRDPA
jgi:CDGSH-type Zn-finger protein